MAKYYRLVSVRFKGDLSNKTYQFKTDFDDLELGDEVVVDTVHGFSVARVVGYDTAASTTKPLKWIVSYINVPEHKERLKKEQEILAVEKQLKQLESELQHEAIQAFLAQRDPMYAQLLHTYNRLTEDML